MAVKVCRKFELKVGIFKIVLEHIVEAIVAATTLTVANESAVEFLLG